MELWVSGFWGAYFGAVALMLSGAIFAFIKGVRRVAVNAALSGIASSFFVVAFLGVLPIQDEDMLARFLAHVACAVSALLAYLLMSILGLLRGHGARRKAAVILSLFAWLVMALGWLVPPAAALQMGLTMAVGLALMALLLTLRGAVRGDRMAWAAVSGVALMLVAIVGLGWIAVDRGGVPWQIHVVSAVAGTAYLANMAGVMWTRYSYLIELHEVMAHGPSYDPVTRMRLYTSSGLTLEQTLRQTTTDGAPLGVVAITIANLYVLKKLYGLPAVNHALFVSAGRLRRSVPAQVRLGRLGNDTFLLLLPHGADSGRLLRLARNVLGRLSKSVILNTSLQGGAMEQQQTHWAAELGVGVMRLSHADAASASEAVVMACKMASTAVSYPSRLAWFDHASGEIVDMPPGLF